MSADPVNEGQMTLRKADPFEVDFDFTSPEVAETMGQLTCFMWPNAPIALAAQSGQSMPMSGQLTL